jgi:hypothetical protein
MVDQDVKKDRGGPEVRGSFVHLSRGPVEVYLPEAMVSQ